VSLFVSNELISFANFLVFFQLHRRFCSALLICFIEIEGYRALEGVQILIGTKNVVVNYGVRNDFIIVEITRQGVLPQTF
jgi:hypothetical protein